MSNIEDPSSDVGGFELPCGYIDQNNVLHTDVVVRGLTGEEEDILGSRNMPVAQKFNTIISRCLLRVGPYSDPREVDKIVEALPQGDRIFLLLAVRRVSLGEEMPFISKCPSCEKESMLKVELGSLETKKMKDPMVRAYNVTLPKSGKQARMVVLDGRGEKIINKAAQTGKDIMSASILARIESIDSKPASIDVLKKLPLADRNFLRTIWEEYEGGVETEIQIDCGHCGEEYATSVDLGSPGFFNPSGALKTWKGKYST